MPVLRRLRQEDCLNPGGRGCSEPRLCHWAAWATRVKLCCREKKKEKERKEKSGGKERSGVKVNDSRCGPVLLG